MNSSIMASSTSNHQGISKRLQVVKGKVVPGSRTRHQAFYSVRCILLSCILLAVISLRNTSVLGETSGASSGASMSVDAPLSSDSSSKSSETPTKLGTLLPEVYTSELNDKLLKLEVRGKLTVEKLWRDLVREAAKDDVFMEVGMFRAKQCLLAARSGFEVHCIEPSPSSFAIIQSTVEKAAEEVQKRVHLYNAAAGDVSGAMVQFKAGGGTGDEVIPSSQVGTVTAKGANKILEVPSMRLDDIVGKLANGIFALKVDTQGYEPSVFAGLSESLKNHKIDFIFTEFWPKGTDKLYGTTSENECLMGANMLAAMVAAGYKLYACHHVIAHPRAPSAYLQAHDRPLKNLHDHCKWYLDLEKRYPAPEYVLGYWSDIVAVSPKAHIDVPKSTFGIEMFGDPSLSATANSTSS